VATASIEIIADSSQVRTATQDLKALAAQGSTVQKGADNASSALGGLGKRAGQAGIQIQQFVGQVQGGQSALVAFSQQAADLGFVLGVPLIGAVISVAAAIAGPLLMSLKDVRSEAEKLPEGVQKFLDEIQKKFDQVDLANRADLARSELGKLNTEYEKAVELVASLSAELKDIGTFGPSSKFVKSGEQYTKAWRDARFALVDAEENLEKIKLKLEKVNEISQTGLGTNSLDDVITKTGETKTASERLSEQLKVQEIALTQGELAARLYSAAIATANGDVSKLDPSIASSITRVYELEQAQRQAAKTVIQSKKDETAAAKQAAAELRALAEEELSDLARQQSARDAFTGLQGQFDQEEQLKQQLQARLDVIREYRATEGADKAAADAAELAALQAHEDAKAEIVNRSAQAQAQAQYAVQQDVLGFTASFAGNLLDVIASSKGKENALYKAAFLAYKATAIAQAVISTETAAAAALAPPPIGLGPVAGLPYSNLIRGLGYASVGIMAGQAIGETFGRALGGQVMGNTPYLVGERGPELFTPNGSGGGRITPYNQLMAEARGGGATQNAPIINITNYGGQAEVTQSRWSEQDRRFILDIVTGDIANRGKVHSAITRNTTAGNRTA
jgi:hypothetical protein